MSGPSVLETQMSALLERVESHRQERCQALAEQAANQAQALRRSAWRAARAAMAQAVASERQRLTRAREVAAAQQESLLRVREQGEIRILLDSAWARIPEALTARWQERKARRAWIDSLLELAFERLPNHPWQVEHPVYWEPAELSHQWERMVRHCGTEPQFHIDTALQAGLRIRVAGACLDGSTAGLLADRAWVEGLLLAELATLSGEAP